MAQRKIESELANVILNCHLDANRRANHQKMLSQASKVVFKISSGLFKQSTDQFRNNFFRLFNLQVAIPEELIETLQVKDKVKILSYLFCKYFRKKEIQNLYEQFLKNVDFQNIYPDSRAKKTIIAEEQSLKPKISDMLSSNSKVTDNSRNLNPVIDDLPQDIKISDLFAGSEDNSFNLTVIRKILVLLVHHSSLFHLYLKIKTNTLRQSSFDPDKTQKMQDILASQCLDDKLPFKISESLVHLPFAELVKLVSISDIQRFVALANVQFLERQVSRKVVMKADDGTLLQFEMTVFEKENLFLAKFKRKDERIKFVFKSIRKQLTNRFRSQFKNGLNVEQIKSKFNKK